jgi:hypothetical protein
MLSEPATPRDDDLCFAHNLGEGALDILMNALEFTLANSLTGSQGSTLLYIIILYA